MTCCSIIRQRHPTDNISNQTLFINKVYKLKNSHAILGFRQDNCLCRYLYLKLIKFK